MARAFNEANWLRRPVPDADSPVSYRMPHPLARQFLQICATAQAEILAGEPVSRPMRYAALATIDDFPDIEQRRLAAMISADRTNAVQIVDDLEAAGLVERRISPNDRRSRELKTTARGKALRRRLRPQVLASQAEVLSPLSAAEQDLLIDLLVRVVEANKELARPGAGRRRPPSKAAIQNGAAIQNSGVSDARKRNDFASRGRNSGPRRPPATRTD